MLLFVTPNPCVERTYLIESFECGQVHRLPHSKVLLNAGGKGINAARIARQFRDDVLSLSWVGRVQKSWFEAQLTRENVPYDLLEVDAETRTCINILQKDYPKTEIVEAGDPLPANAGEELLARLKVLLPQVSLLAVCGSYPPGAFDDHLVEIAKLAAQHNVPLLVDGKGIPMRRLLQAKLPLWAIKPNTDEAAELVGHPLSSSDDEIAAIKVLLEHNVENVVLSCGGRGAYLGNVAGISFVEAPQVPEVSAVGSGDSLVGALCAKWLESGDIDAALRWGIAAGAANASQQKSAFCTRGEIEQLYHTMN